MTLCAVIPAAGRGSRLGADCPKILVKIAPHLSIWNVLSDNLCPVVDCINVIVSPEGQPLFNQELADRPVGKQVIVSLQPSPRGMGDAIFQGIDVWQQADHILVIWGDQVHVSQKTLNACITAHTRISAPHLTIPVVSLPTPYVEYVFSPDGELDHIKQSREGDVCTPNGWGDVGTFILSTQGLKEAWDDYLETKPQGALTGELNFLPFMIFLSQNKQWPITRIIVEDPDEARGINTQEDLLFFKKLYACGNQV